MEPRFRVVPGDLREAGDPVAVIQAELRRYPQAHAIVAGHQVRVEPQDADGFTVAFTDRRGRYRVDCEGWHAQFRDVREAVGCFTSALSPTCRLKVWRRGGVAYRWDLQAQSDGAWVQISSVSSVVVLFWCRLEVVFLQNRLLEAA